MSDTALQATSFPDVLARVLPVYEIPNDNLAGEVLIPGMANAEAARVGAGFFSSRCLAQIAQV